MKLQHLPTCLMLAFVASPLACGGADDDVMLGNDHAGDKSSGGSAGSKSSAGSASGGAATTAGSHSGGSSNGGKASTAGSANAGSATGGSAGAGGYEPCAGKACGDFCSPCDPKDTDCVAPAVEQTCTALGQCSIGRPNCSAPPTCDDGQQYYAPGCSAMARPAEPIVAPPLVAGCYTPCTAAKACPDGYGCRSAWYDPSAACAPGDACIAACGASADLCFENLDK